MKIKVCGLREPGNILEIIQNDIDFIGHIFYEKSTRFISKNPQITLPENIKKTGVFVNDTVDNIFKKITDYELNVVQLHGNETPEFCRTLYMQGIQLIKAFSVDESFDFEKTTPYQPFCKYFLFDSSGQFYGGNGTLFNWELLKKYNNELPFFLSGGIGPEHIDDILALRNTNMAGIDVNSRFESAPGIKDVNSINKMVQKIRKHEQLQS